MPDDYSNDPKLLDARDRINAKVAELDLLIRQLVPRCPRRSVALRHLETSGLFAVKGLFKPEEEH